MKKIIISVLCLAFFSLACLSTAAAGDLDVSGEVGTAPALTNTPATVDPVRETISPTLVTVQRCAVVIASEALHLRSGASESSAVLTWLKRGGVVQVVSDSYPNWTRVRFEGFEGFARSIYLQELECVK